KTTTFFSYTTPPSSSHYTLSLHDALPILPPIPDGRQRSGKYAKVRKLSLCGCRLPGSEPRRRKTTKARRLRKSFHTRGLSSKTRSEEHTSELQSLRHLVCRLLLEKKKKKK